MLSVEEEATGCLGASGYKAFAREKGFTYCEVLDWTSSAGDWCFLVATNKRGPWRILWQTNNYPRPGFSHTLDDREWWGTLRSVYRQIEREQR